MAARTGLQIWPRGLLVVKAKWETQVVRFFGSMSYKPTTCTNENKFSWEWELKEISPMNPQRRKSSHVTWWLLPSTSRENIKFPGLLLTCFSSISGCYTAQLLCLFHVKSTPGTWPCGSLESTVIQQWGKPDMGPTHVKLTLRWGKYQIHETLLWWAYARAHWGSQQGFLKAIRLEWISGGWAEVDPGKEGKEQCPRHREKSLWWEGVRRIERMMENMAWNEARGKGMGRKGCEYGKEFFSLRLEGNVNLTTVFKHAGDVSRAHFRNLYGLQCKIIWWPDII